MISRKKNVEEEAHLSFVLHNNIRVYIIECKSRANKIVTASRATFLDISYFRIAMKIFVPMFITRCASCVFLLTRIYSQLSQLSQALHKFELHRTCADGWENVPTKRDKDEVEFEKWF